MRKRPSSLYTNVVGEIHLGELGNRWMIRMSEHDARSHQPRNRRGTQHATEDPDLTKLEPVDGDVW